MNKYATAKLTPLRHVSQPGKYMFQLFLQIIPLADKAASHGCTKTNLMTPLRSFEFKQG